MKFLKTPMRNSAGQKTSCDREDCQGNGGDFMTPIFML